MILLILVGLLCVFVASLVYVEHKKLADWHAAHAERAQLELRNKNLAVRKDAKVALAKAGEFDQRLDGMLIEVRQAVELMRRHDLEQLLAEVREAIEKNEELAILAETNLRNTESLMNDPRVQRAIKSG